jgi:hypothetical protein
MPKNACFVFWHALCPLKPPPQKKPYENGKMKIEDIKGK